MQARLSQARQFAPLLFVCLLLAAFPTIASAATLIVPSQYATIGAAVAAASDGDTIQLMPGTYNDTTNDLNLEIDKSLTFEAAGTAADTIIDCAGNNDFIQTLGGNNLNLTFQNLTFQDCSSLLLDFNGSNGNTIDINGCVFTDLGSEALETDQANDITLTSCTISDNTGSNLFSLTGGTISVANSTFSSNQGSLFLTDQVTGTISNCTFASNGAGGEFGSESSIFWQDAPLTIIGTSFTNNQAGEGGGAIGVNAATADSPLTLDSCTFAGNAITGTPGGAVYLQPNGSNVSLVASDCVFLNNSSDTDGSAIGGSASTTQITNCSFFGNSYTGGSPSGQGTVACGGATLTITNSILYGDTTPNEISTASPPASTTVTYSDVQGGVNGVDNNIVADPMYANPSSGDLHLLNSSPCVQAGTTTGAPEADFSQYAWGNTVSMGAYSPIHFDFSTPGSASVGDPFSFDVTAMAADDSTTITNFSDTVHFTSSDSEASLPIDSTLANGTGMFDATLNTTGNQTITATDTLTSSITGTSSAIAVSVPALTTFQPGLQMISAPEDYTGDTLSQIFSPGGESLAVWQPALGNYAITPTAPADTIHVGVGYWVRFAATTTLYNIGRRTNRPPLPFSIALTKGWNMIGNPFSLSVPLSTIEVEINGSESAFPGAGGRWGHTPVMDYLYTYPVGATQYQKETSTLEPYAGYWIYAYENCTLVIPPRLT